MKISVNQQSKGKPENIYEGGASEMFRSAYKIFEDQYPELICLTPTGELAKPGPYETDGEVVWQYKHGEEWLTNQQHTSKMLNIPDCSKRQVYFVTTPVNEQPKEEMCIVCDEEISHKSFCADCGLNRIEDRPAPSLAPVEIPINCLHATCPSCGENVDVIPSNGTFIKVDGIAPVDESVEERAERVYGNDPNMYGAQRDGFIAGYNECLKEHVRLDDVVRVLDGYVWDGKILASDLSEIANKLYSLNKNTNE